VQLITEFYGCPSGVHGGKTDSCFPNVQCGIEKAMSTLFPVLAGAVGIGTVGHLENAVTFSPLQLVVDSEVSRAVRHTLRPIEVNDQTLALDMIRRVGIGGNYLAETHTAEHFRDELFLSTLFETVPWSTAHSASVRGMENRAHARAREIWQQEPSVVIDRDQAQGH
jgi:trimethylamine---corrinoid protein Co-methyltransferase